MMMRTFLAAVVLIMIGQEVSYCQTHAPRARKGATVVESRARFTVLTPRVIRMEWSEDGRFEDRASLTFVIRDLPVPEYSVTRTADGLAIKTSAITLRYRNDGNPFNASNLSAHFGAGNLEGDWHPGMENKGNLLGTTRTLDSYDGTLSTKDSSTLKLEPGMLSRDGWVMIDDSERPLFDDSDYPWVVARDGKRRQDYYFFAYGRDYKVALKDFIAVAGRIALPPRFAFGYWFSRWRSFSEMEFRELVGTFKDLGVPLDVLVIDMDWHLTSNPEFFTDLKRGKDQAKQDYGWTGYTWNKNLFPDPKRFLDWTDAEGLKTCLNLHPASGLQPHEEQYPAMARAMGIDPSTKKYVPFNIVDKEFARNYFNLVLHPMERMGVDFWWLDWQQWNNTPIPGVNPTFYLNYVHYTDMERERKVRPLIYHRWGGLGNHRYQIGFSGDTKITWSSLDFQPYFTSTAANVGFGYWGNDIGGFFGEPNTPEQFLRWFQFGVFSPILKTHATSRNYAILRKIWEYPPETFLQLRELVKLRHALLPYIYTAARTAYDDGVSICHPMYYDYPEQEEAYAFRNEYMFGNDILVHPVTHQIGRDSLFTLQPVWLPPGSWYEWSTGAVLEGGRVVQRALRVQDLPVYVRSGAILPMQPTTMNAGSGSAGRLFLTIAPGAAGSTSIYEDAGNDESFKKGEYSRTPIQFENNSGKMKIVIGAAKGSFHGMPVRRSYELRLLNSFPPARVRIDGKEIPYSDEAKPRRWHYDGNNITTVISIPEMPVSARKEIVVDLSEGDIALLSGKKGQFDVLYQFSKFLSDKRNYRRQDLWNDAKYSSDLVMKAAQTGLRITMRPGETKREIREFESDRQGVIDLIDRVAGEHAVYAPYLQLLRSAKQ